MADITPNVVVTPPQQLFTMPNAFKAVFNGYVYIGVIDSDPTIIANQIQVYVTNEDGSYTEVSQPLRTNAGGYLVYNGQASKFVTVQGFSMTVQDSNHAQVNYYPNILKYDPDQLRAELETSGINIIKNGVKSVKYFADLVSGRHGIVDEIITIEHHAGGLGGSYYMRSGTTGMPSTGNEVLAFDADGVGWKMIKRPSHSAREFGVKGDAVDDLAACKRASDFIGQNGGGELLFDGISGKDDVKLGNNWNITYDGVSLLLAPDIHIHTEAATTDGHCIGFIGPLSSASGRIKQVGIVGGKVSANGSTNLDNAIGFAGTENFWAKNVHILHADRKGVTAQVNVVNGVFSDILIDSTNYDAVTIEGDTVNNTIITKNIVVENVTVTSAGRDGLHVAGNSVSNLVDGVVIRNFRCDASVGSGVNIGLSQNVYIDDSTRINNSGVYGFNITNSNSISGRVNTLNSQNAGVVLVGCGRVRLDASITNAGLAGSASTVPWDAFYIANSTDPHIFTFAEVYGSTHRYLINAVGTAIEHVFTFPRPGVLANGVSGLLGTNAVMITVTDPGEQVTTTSVALVVGSDNILLNPSTATNYTTLSGAIVGKLVNVRLNGSATIVHGSTSGTFRVKGGANVTPAAGSMMSFLYTGEGLWREVARNF